MDAVRATDHRSVAIHMCLRGDRAIECFRGPDQKIRGAGELQGQRRVDDIARREPVVHPRTLGLTDALLHDVDEGRDVVFGRLLALVDRGNVEARASPHCVGGGLRHHTDLGPRFRGEDLDLQPRAETRLVAEQLGHLGQRIPGNHSVSSSVSGESAQPADNLTKQRRRRCRNVGRDRAT